MAIVGKGGSVKFDNESIAEMNSWNLKPSSDEIDTTSFDSGEWKEYMGGLNEWSGSFEGNLVKAHVIKVFGKLGVTASIELKVTATDGSITFTGQAFLTSIDVDVPVGDKATMSADFRGTGALSPAAA